MDNNERESMAVACCLTCSLSDAMKDCNTCPFKAGLIIKALRDLKALDGDYPAELRVKTLSNLKLSIR